MVVGWWLGGGWVGGRPNLVLSPGPGLWSLVLGPSGPDLGPDLGPGPGPELDNRKGNGVSFCWNMYLGQCCVGFTTSNNNSYQNECR